jgi:hypothetical protein
MARILDNAKAVNQQPAAAKVLAAMLEKTALAISVRTPRRSVAGSDDD